MENGPGETESQNHRIAFAKGRVKPLARLLCYATAPGSEAKGTE